MSTAKSIIEIDVKDEKFKAFQKTFDLYQNALKTLPKNWTSADKAAVDHAQTIDTLLAKLEKHQKSLDKGISDSNQKLKDTAKWSGEIALNFASAALSVAKWLTLGALGGGFGLGALAAAASSERKQSQGLGISIGDLKASKLDLGSMLGSPESVLGNIAEMKNDLSRRQILNRLGGKDGQSAAEMLPSLIKNALSVFNKTKGLTDTKQYAEAMGLTQVFTLEDLRRMSAMTEKELSETIEAFQRDRQKLNVPDRDAEQMQKFWKSLGRAGEEIESKLIKALVPLTPSLIKLSETVTDAVANFIKSKEVKTAIEDFSKWLGSENAKKDIQGFFDGLSTMAKIMLQIGTVFGVVGRGIGNAAGAISEYVFNDSSSAKHAHSYMQELKSEDADKRANAEQEKLASEAEERKKNAFKIAWDSLNHPDTASLFSKLEKGNQLPDDLLSKVRQVESGGNDKAVSGKGAKGPFQFVDDTAKEYGLKDPYDLKSSADAAAKKLHHLMQKYNNNLADALAAYNWGEGHLDAFIRGDKGYSKLPDQTNDYLHKFNIYVTTSAGSDLNTIAKAM